MAHGPALPRFDHGLRRAQQAGFAHDELPVRAQVAHRQRPAKLVQRMLGMRHEQHAQRHEGRAGESLRDERRDRQIGATGDEHLARAGDDGFVVLDPRVRAVRVQLVEAFQ